MFKFFKEKLKSALNKFTKDIDLEAEEEIIDVPDVPEEIEDSPEDRPEFYKAEDSMPEIVEQKIVIDEDAKVNVEELDKTKIPEVFDHETIHATTDSPEEIVAKEELVKQKEEEKRKKKLFKLPKFLRRKEKTAESTEETATPDESDIAKKVEDAELKLQKQREEQRKAEEAKKRIAEEKRRLIEEAKKQKETEEKALAEKKKQEELRKKEGEKRLAEEKERLAAEAKRKEEENARIEEEKRQFEEAKKLLSQKKEEAKQLAEEKRQEEEQRLADEAKRLEEEKQKAENERKKQEEDRLAEEKQRKDDEQKRQEKEAKKQREAEEQRQKELELAKKQELERKEKEERLQKEQEQIAEDEKKQKQEQIAQEKEAEEEKQKKLEEAKVAQEIKKPEESKDKRGFFSKLRHAIVTKKLNESQFNDLFWDLEIVLLESNVAVQAIQKIKNDLKEVIVDKPIPRKKIEETIINALKKSIEDLFKVEQIDLLKRIKLKEEKPYVICFVGINGSGKTTTIAKVTQLLKTQGHSVVLAAADTFRAAAIDQLEHHANALDVKIIKHSYGSDPAAVAFDAIKHAKASKKDVVLIDTAGRLHSNTNLIEEMKKIMRVAKPDIKIFVGEAITGNDCVEQAQKFNEAVELDGIILSKADIDEKGGASISISYVTGKPILYLGTGQKYSDLTKFESSVVIDGLGL